MARRSKADERQQRVETARGLLVHALFMLNELPTADRLGSAIAHAIAAGVVLIGVPGSLPHAARIVRMMNESAAE